MGDELAARFCLTDGEQQVGIHPTFQNVSESSHVHAGMYEVAVSVDGKVDQLGTAARFLQFSTGFEATENRH